MFLLVWYFFRPLLSNDLIALFANKTPLCYSSWEGNLTYERTQKTDRTGKNSLYSRYQ